MILIVGGLIAVGLVAAIAGVFLALGEQRSQNRAAELTATPAQVRLPAREERQAPLDAQKAKEAEDEAEAQLALSTADIGTPTLVEKSERAPEPPENADRAAADGIQLQSEQRTEAIAHPPLLETGEEQLASGLARQYEALTRELREVHQQSNEIERRLALLNEIATRFEQMQHGRNGYEAAGSEEREVNTETNLRSTPSRALNPYR